MEEMDKGMPQIGLFLSRDQWEEQGEVRNFEKIEARRSYVPSSICFGCRYIEHDD
ncbi:hypothetical protein Syun_004533 [Stephania yunnanensis]|uniref:Uncharacterized protein n=1 Tax=Stephania yunnanensis TaxID=152371 RepID=A0AAP0Q518_9MAGN